PEKRSGESRETERGVAAFRKDIGPSIPAPERPCLVQMEPRPRRQVTRVPPYAPGVRAVADEEGEQGHLVARGRELLRHLERDDRPQAVPSDGVRTAWLHRADLVDVVGRHRFDGAMGRLAVEALRLEREERLVRPETAAEIA